MRLFAALDIDDVIRARISRFMEGVSGFSPEARWVTAESLHITLKFIGEKPESEISNIRDALKLIRSSPMEIQMRGLGFFPAAKAPRVFWIGIDGGEPLRSLAHSVDAQLKDLGIPEEEHAYNPHLTLARARG